MNDKDKDYYFLGISKIYERLVRQYGSYRAGNY